MPKNSAKTIVGLVGVGRLGFAIAQNLIRRGHRVVGYKRSGVDDLVAAGGEAAEHPAELARRADLVLIVVPDGDALDSVINGEVGLIAGLRPGGAVFDLGTYSMAARERARNAAAAQGASYLDCSVSGNPVYVKARTAALFASGDAGVFKQYQSVLKDITTNVTFVGGFGAGTALKLIVTALIPVHTLAAAEAMNLATRAGVDRKLVFDAICGTPASSGMFETRGKAMVTGEHSTAVSLERYLKNVSMTMELVEKVGGDFPLLKTMYRVYHEAVEAGFGTLDQSAIFDYLTCQDR